MLLDIINSKILNHPLLLGKRHDLKIFEKISLDNKTIEQINLSRIFHEPLTKAALPSTSAQKF